MTTKAIWQNEFTIVICTIVNMDIGADIHVGPYIFCILFRLFGNSPFFSLTVTKNS